MKIETRDTTPIVGIDLGTTNSLVAIVKDGVPVVLEARDGGHLVPSVVTFPESLKNGAAPGTTAPSLPSGANASSAFGAGVVGRVAKRAKVTDSRHTAYSVKRLLGRSLADLDPATLPYEIVSGGEGAIRIRIGDRLLTAVEISAMILRELKATAEKSLGTTVTRAVITVPAYFNDSQRQATRAAGRLAGLDVLRIVNEPTAAALAYGLDRKKQGLIAVYDLGGGTFDVSILRLQDGIFEVLATSGDTQLGGDDLDRLLADVCAKELREHHDVDPASDRELLATLLEASERAKITLSTEPTAKIEFALPGNGGARSPANGSGKHARYVRTFTRAEFESLALPLLERTREPCLRALQDAGLKAEDLSDVILVGGPTRLPIVQNTARAIFNRAPNTSMHPDEVVALGAAIQADILAGNTKELLLLDVVPLSLGIETYGGVMSTLIPRNTKIPAVERETFTTFVDNQTGVDIHVLQGEREKVDDNRSLARFKLKGIDPLPAGLARVEVSFLIDADGILEVSAKDLRTGNEQAIEVRPSFGLTEDEIHRMLQAQADHAQEDVSYRELVEAKNSAEAVLRATERTLPEAERLLPAPEFAAITTDLEALRTALGGRDPDRVRAASYQLSRSTASLADLIVAEAIKKASKGNRPNA